MRDVTQDFVALQADHRTLTASQSTAITFNREVRAVRVTNWDTVNRVLFKTSTIGSDTDAAAARCGKAPKADVPSETWFPVKGRTFYVRSAGASEITVEGYS